MKSLVNKYLRCIYVIKFDDNSAYIGLTFDFNKRKSRHKYESHNNFVKEKMEKGVSFEFVKLTDYLDIESAINREEYFINYYKDEGATILNLTKAGALGYSG